MEDELVVEAGGNKFGLGSRRGVEEFEGYDEHQVFNLYLFLAIHAGYRGGRGRKLGYSFWKRAKIATMTGLSLSQLCTAQEHLEAAGLIKTQRRGSTSIGYKIVEWGDHHDAEKAAHVEGGYVRISRSIAKRPRRWLFSNPELSRVWLAILMKTRVEASRTHSELRRGHCEIDFDEFENGIGVCEDTLRSNLEEARTSNRRIRDC